MNTMNRIKRPSLSDTAVARMIDPRTNEPLRPLGFVGGRAVWPMLGASPDDPSSEENNEGGEKKTEGEGDPEGGSKPKEGEGGDPDAKIAALEDEKNRHVRRRQEAETKAAELEARLSELESKDTPELEKLTTKVNDLTSENNLLAEALRTARLENAFLSDNTHAWHAPGRALKMADLSDVEIDDDGTVHGLKEALAKLAKSDPYLIKQDEGKSKDDELPDTSGKGTPNKKEQKRESEADARKKLHDKYPALRR